MPNLCYISTSICGSKTINFSILSQFQTRDIDFPHFIRLVSIPSNNEKQEPKKIPWSRWRQKILQVFKRQFMVLSLTTCFYLYLIKCFINTGGHGKKSAKFFTAVLFSIWELWTPLFSFLFQLESFQFLSFSSQTCLKLFLYFLWPI